MLLPVNGTDEARAKMGIVGNMNAREAARTALLLYDARHSRPKEVAFAVGQRVVADGVAYRVEAVEPLLDGPRLHHVEVSLRR